MEGTHRVRLRTGIEMEYEERGAGDRPFVLVHGFTGSRDDWREQMAPLSELGRTLAVDQRGHGGSTNTGKRETYTLDQLADDLEAFQAELGIARADLLGHSLGGMVALRFTLRYPERVASLILMNTSPEGVLLAPRPLIEGGAHIGRLGGMTAVAVVMREGNRRGEGTRMAPATQRCAEAMGEDVWWARTQAKIEQMDPEAFAALGIALSEQEPVTDRLREIACPTTVIVGDQDTAFLDPSRKMAEGIPGAVSVVLPETAHNGQLESPEAWLDAIRAHLERARG